MGLVDLQMDIVKSYDTFNASDNEVRNFDSRYLVDRC